LYYQRAKEVNSIGAYEDFLKRYSKGKFSDEARNKIEELEALQKKRDMTLSNIKKINLLVEAGFLTEEVFPGALKTTMPARKKHKVEEWLRSILIVALEQSGYKVEEREKEYDAELLAKFSENLVRIHTPIDDRSQLYKYRGTVINFELELLLNHRQYGKLFETTISGSDVEMAPSEKIKDDIVKDLQNKLPFK
jgi:hypothetical protein